MPVTKISEPGGTRWTGFIAAGNPILYKFQRGDFPYNISTEVGTTITTVIGGGVNLSANFSIGDQICIVSDFGNVTRFGIVTSSTYSSPNTTIVSTGGVNDDGVFFIGVINLITKRPLYKLSVRIFDANTNTDQFGFDFDYYPFKSGLIKVDITSAIQSLISPEIPFTPANANQWFEDNARKDFYIKYTEFWAGSANSQISDFRSPKKALFATNQIGQAGNQIARGQVLGNPFSIFKEVLNVLTIDKSFTGVNYLKTTGFGVSHFFPLDTVFNKLKSVFWRPFENIFVSQSVSSNQGWAAVNSTNWITLVNPGEQSEWAAIILNATTNSFFDLYFDLDGQLNTASTCVLTIRCYDFSNTLLNSYAVPITFTASINSFKGRQTITAIGNIGHLEFAIGTVTGSVNIFSLKTRTDIKATATMEVRSDVTFSALTGRVNVNFSGGKPTLALPQAEIVEPCSNSFNLVWRNRFGGLSNFVFPLAQEYFFTYSKNKALQYILYAESVKLDQLNLLHDLNTTGEVYSPVYDELSLTANSTAKRVGSQVYKLDEDGRLTGVIVIPSAPKYSTGARLNKFQVTVEMPEVYRLPTVFQVSTGAGIFDSTFDDTFE